MPDFTEFLDEQLTAIDGILAPASVSIDKRPLRAAIMFVDACMVGISEPTETYLGQPWFARLHRMVKDWYELRYGKARFHPDKHLAVGVALVFGSPHKVEIPLTILERLPTPDEAWVHFPTGVRPTEKPLQWLTAPPNLDKLSKAEFLELERSITRLATALRRFHNGLLTAEFEEESGGNPLPVLLAHLKKAADDICSPEPANRSTAIWEVHLALEKTAKAYLRQRHTQVPRSHDLRHLYGLATSSGLHPLPGGFPPILPGASEAIQHRYGEAGIPRVGYAIEVFGASVEIMAHFAIALHRKYEFADARFHIRVPPWDREA